MAWAIYSDLSGCTETSDGPFPDEASANERLIQLLESQLDHTTDRLADAKRRRRRLNTYLAHEGSN